MSDVLLVNETRSQMRVQRADQDFVVTSDRMQSRLQNSVVIV